MENDSVREIEKEVTKQAEDLSATPRGIKALIRHPVIAPVIAALIVNIILRAASYLLNIDLKGF